MGVDLKDITTYFDSKMGLDLNKNPESLLHIDEPIKFMIHGEEKKVFRYGDFVLISKNQTIDRYYEVLTNYYCHKIAETMFPENTPKLRGVIAIPFKDNMKGLEKYGFEELEQRCVYVVDFVDLGNDYNSYVHEFYRKLRNKELGEMFIPEEEGSIIHKRAYEENFDRIKDIVDVAEKYNILFDYSEINTGFVDGEPLFIELVDPVKGNEKRSAYNMLFETLKNLELDEDKRHRLREYILAYKRAVLLEQCLLDVDKIKKMLEKGVIETTS